MFIDRRFAFLVGGLLPLASPAGAQVTPPAEPVRGLESFAAPQATPPQPTPTPSAIPIPPAPRIVLPAATPTPRAPVRATPTSTPRPTTTPAPRTDASPAPVSAPTPRPASETPPAAAPSLAEQPAPTPVPVGPPADQPAPTPAASDLPLIPIGIAVLLVLAGLAFFLRRRRPTEPLPAEPLPATPLPATPAPSRRAPAPEPAPAVADPSPTRARLSITQRPIRAGLNMLSATTESEILVANTGGAPAEGVRVDVRLLAAHPGLEADLAELRAAPIGRPAVPPFTLAPGEERRFTAVAALPRDAIRPLAAGGRPMFVPIVSVNLLYQTAGQPAQTAQAFAVGIERVDSPKLAPLWLDAPARMHDHVAARPQGAAVERFG